MHLLHLRLRQQFFIRIFSFLFFSFTLAEGAKNADEAIVYKSVKTKKGEFVLKLHLFYPSESKSKKRPCMVMFHGGGWNNGAPTRCFGEGKNWASKGMVAISVEYRVSNVHGGTALDSVSDAKSAMRWIRAHAKKLNIDPEKIAAQGSSAGGHLAIACATLSDFDTKGEDTSISCKPNALILKSPVLDNGPKGYGQYKPEVQKHWKDFSPFHNIKKGVPPMFISVGDREEKYLRVSIAKELKKQIEALGEKCELMILKGATHRKRTTNQHKRVREAKVKFLQSQGFIGQ